LSLQTAFKGKVYMTHATKAIYKLLLLDFVRVSKVAVEDMLYDEHDLERSMAKIEVGCPLLPCSLLYSLGVTPKL
jgi:cleavage and polyadenylation specificity factor subunit 3